MTLFLLWKKHAISWSTRVVIAGIATHIYPVPKKKTSQNQYIIYSMFSAVFMWSTGVFLALLRPWHLSRLVSPRSWEISELRLGVPGRLSSNLGPYSYPKLSRLLQRRHNKYSCCWPICSTGAIISEVCNQKKHVAIMIWEIPGLESWLLTTTIVRVREGLEKPSCHQTASWAAPAMQHGILHPLDSRDDPWHPCIYKYQLFRFEH